MNGHPTQNAAASQRDPADAWRGIVALVEAGNVSEMRISSVSRQMAVLLVRDLLKEFAESDPFCDDGAGWLQCHYCEVYELPHAPDCLHERARALCGYEKEAK